MATTFDTATSDVSATIATFNGPNIVRVASGNRYLIFQDASSGTYYRKSTDNGLTWAPRVVLDTQSTRLCVWYDRWTPGDSGNLIHIWYTDTAVHDIQYRNLDVSSDTLSSEVQVFNGASFSDLNTATNVSGAKSRGGNLYVYFDGDNGTEAGFYRSTDGGANWTSRASPNEATGDQVRLFPGNYADNNDMDLVFWDISANELSLKVYDDSGDSWAETSIAASMTDIALSTVNPQFSGSIRHSDGHLLLGAWNSRDSASSDLQFWDINGSGSITAKTNVVTNSDDCQGCAVQINQSNDQIVVYYLGKSDGTETIGTATGIYYKTSTDGGSTWSAEQTITSTQSNYPAIWCDLGYSGASLLMAVMDRSFFEWKVTGESATATGGGQGWWG